MLIGIALFLVAGVVGIVLVREGGDPMPASIDGVPRLTTSQARADSDTIEKAMETIGGKAQIAFYGYGSATSFMVAVYEESAEVAFDQEFRAFSYSFMGTSGADLDPTSIVDETNSGIHYRCQSDAESSISLCVMGEGSRYVGMFVADSAGSDSALSLAKKVQVAIEDVEL